MRLSRLLFACTLAAVTPAAAEMYYRPKPTIVSVELVDGRIEVTKRKPVESWISPASSVGRPVDEIWKEIYVVDGGEIVLRGIAHGKIVKAEERVEFGEEKPPNSYPCDGPFVPLVKCVKGSLSCSKEDGWQCADPFKGAGQ